MNLKKKTIIYLILGLSISLVACKNKTKESEDQIVQIDSDDKDMNKAINKAQETLNSFREAFDSNKYEDYTIKAMFKTKDNNIEHMWVNNLQYINGQFLGTLANTPMGEMDITHGDSIKINNRDISDWMYIDPKTNTIYGGYTMRVIYNRMSDDQKAQFEEQMGGKFSE